MDYETVVATILRDFAEAHVAASANARELLSGGDVAVCRARMVRLHEAQAALDLIDDEGAPAELLALREADADRGCTRCWAMSLHSRKHPECREKIALWFAAVDALVARFSGGRDS